MADALAALRASVDRLADLVRPLGDSEVTKHAYPSAWTIADVLSHVGSSGVIWQRGLEDSLADRETPDGFAAEVWGEWDPKSPPAKVADALAVDDAFTSRLETLAPAERSRVSLAMGPMTFAWDEVIATRLNEHLLHEWDVAVALDPAAVLPPDGVAHVIDNLDLIARYTAQPVAPERTVTVATTDPERSFAITVATQTVEFSPGNRSDSTLVMPAEAFIRLVYGRLDPEHTPSTLTGDTETLEQLRQVFPGP